MHSDDEYLRALFELTSESILLANAAGRYVDANEACCGLLGYRRDELLGKTFEDLIEPQARPRLANARAQLLAEARHLDEWTLVRKDGTTVPVEMRVRLLGDGRRVGLFHDISLRHRSLGAAREAAEALERRVQERTAELEDAYRNLRLGHEALQTSEQSYRTLVDWSPEAVVVHREGRLAYVNPSAIKLFGARSEAELLGSLILDRVRPDFHAVVRECTARTAEQGVPSPMIEVGLLRLDGTGIEAEMQSIPLSYEGRPALLASIRDITQSRRDESALRRSRARLRGVFESASDAILIADAARTIVTANPAAGRMLGYAPEAMIGAPLERFIPARFREAHRQYVPSFGASSVSTRAMGTTRDVKGLRADGSEFPIEVSISHVNVDGAPLYTAILRDITDRLRIESELRAGKATLEAALTSMSTALFITDAEGRLLNFNQAFATFHRFADRGLCPTTLDEYPSILAMWTADGEPAPPDRWPVGRAMRGESATHAEYWHRRKDTGEGWVGSYSFAPIRSAEGEVIGTVVTARDITEQRNAQAELESSHAALRRLIAAQDRIQEEERKRIARDLHDDLQQTLAGLRIELSQFGERLAADPASVLTLVSEVDHLAQAAVISTRRIVNDLRPQMLEDLGVASALQVMGAQFSERTGIACRVDAPDAVGAALMDLPAVATGLYRIAQEALNNVVKHARATRVEIRLDREHHGLIVLRVSDNGIGIRRRRRPQPESVGLLGMAERVRALGGQLRIEGQADGGTVVEVLLPSVVPRPADAVPMAIAPEAATELPGLTDAWGQPLQDVIDALAGNVAVLDRTGTIRLVNRAWRSFAERHGDVALCGTSPGVNYLEVGRGSAAGDPSAGRVLDGVGEVLTGRRAAYVDEYVCELPDGPVRFRVHAAGATGGIAIVTHIDLESSALAAPDDRPGNAVP
jgi:PAS domain S-box-containing protein